MGPLNNPVLIPRSFDDIFNSIVPLLGKKCVGFECLLSFVWPISFCSVVSFWSSEWLGRSKWIGHSCRLTTARTLEEQSSSPGWDDRRSNVENDISVKSSVQRELFVTFVEISNNYIDDLFDDDILNKAPQSKQLRDDSRDDVKEIEVQSSEEAIELLNMALKRRRIAHTQLNTESSRSHSVLSMRLVHYSNEIPTNALVTLQTRVYPHHTLSALVERRLVDQHDSSAWYDGKWMCQSSEDCRRRRERSE